MIASESFTRTIIDCPNDTIYRPKETERILRIEDTADDHQALDIVTFIINRYAENSYILIKTIKKIIHIEIPVSIKCNYKNITLTPRINIKQPVARAGFKRGQRRLKRR